MQQILEIDDQVLINVTSGLNICKMIKKIELKSRSISFYFLQYHLIFHLYWFY